MWRSNVTRLRNRSSAASWRNTRPYSSQRGLPITDDEFDEALASLCDRCVLVTRRSDRRPYSLPIGFAISGGVDSMALASLYARSRAGFDIEHASAQKNRHLFDSGPMRIDRPPAFAFIVDHKVRPESTEEAEWVAEQCRSKFGLQASILPLTWPVNFDPLDYNRFETDARTLRYQALGRACHEHGIKDLFVAHHADDQAETIMMRLANNRLRSGLQAMQPVDWIPECSGIHGVSHSDVVRQSWNTRDPTKAIEIERGGVRIVRPLLGFDKARLIATCEQHGVTWAEDKTNHMQTYTSRNAIRHILKNHRLPAALSIPSLVDVSVHMQRRVDIHKSKANELLKSCQKQLDIQIGSLLITFPPFHKLLNRPVKHPERLSLGPPSAGGLPQSAWNFAKNTASCLLTQAGQIVSPKEVTSPGEIASKIANIWPEFSLEGVVSEEIDHPESAEDFCIHGVWWRRRENQRSSRHRALLPESKHQWLLTRQPPEQARATAAPRKFAYPPSHILPLTQDDLPSASAPSKYEFQLFDGRWWISVVNHSTDTLVLRHFTKEDLACMKPLHSAKYGGPEQFVAVALSVLKPADIRFTLPALFRQDTATKNETLIGFPTLDVSTAQLGYPEDVCSWRVRYKKPSYEHESLHDDHHHHDDILASLNLKPTQRDMQAELRKFNIKPSKKTPSTPQRRELPSDTSSPTPRTRSPKGSSTRDTSDVATKVEADSLPSRTKSLSKSASFPIVPAAESRRRGWSEKREGGGYGIKWRDIGKRI